MLRKCLAGFLVWERGNEGFRTEAELESDDQETQCILRRIFGGYLSYLRFSLLSASATLRLLEIAMEFFACLGSPPCRPFNVF